jgi:hypothetical protein
MKSINNVQTTEALNEKAIAPTWQYYIVEDLSDEVQAAVSGGRQRRVLTLEDIQKIDWSIGIG